MSYILIYSFCLIEIRVMARSIQTPHRDVLKSLEKKLMQCCNQENNSDSAA